MLPLPVLLKRIVSVLSLVVEGGNAILCHPLVTALQFHGIWLVVLLGTLWVIAGKARLREVQRQRRHALERRLGNSNSHGIPASLADEQEAGQAKLPPVTVVLPVRGCRSHSMDNWRSVLHLNYGGSLEFVFVLEDKTDPAHAVISALIRELQGRRPVRVQSAGFAEHTSQKIHNLLAGIRQASADSQYVLCLDDDVLLHPGLLASLIRDMEADPGLFMATGYPFDVPAGDAGLLSYAALSYHLPLIVPFSVKERIEFVWGGCMLFRTAEMRHDSRGVLRAWADGGYSDDLTVASQCTEQQLTIYCPGYSIFPQWIEGDYPVRRYWNYLRRQLYVMDTYSNAHNRRTNHGLAAFHAFASWSVVLPATTVMLRLALWFLAILLLPTQQVYGGPGGGGSYLWLRLFGIDRCPWSLVSLAAFSLSIVYLMLALRWMTSTVMDLFCALNPKLKRQQLDTFCWPKLWLGFYVNNAVIPLCIAYTFLTKHIDWSGIRYWRQGGRVVRVVHSQLQP
ncbi:hypothetical protein D9Q98_007774 [Chlorella vulgaris]|uniref:ceramide glucosyltransferase n=1 Tax=Chlorella vulgaris TaxID=3077 RepID=A0A9D4THI4_CHLVU|nr:hypothetical protein D9Q98_007774 [Chlorella vulgaris]